jgi:hypothetical protein
MYSSSIEHLPSKHKALSSPATQTKQAQAEKEREKKPYSLDVRLERVTARISYCPHSGPEVGSQGGLRFHCSLPKSYQPKAGNELGLMTILPFTQIVPMRKLGAKRRVTVKV